MHSPLRARVRSGSTHGAVALCLILATGTAQAVDPVIDQIDAAKRAYEAGDAAVAIQALNFAVAQIEQQQTAKQLELFPEPLPGWTAEQAAADSAGIAAMLTGKVLSRSYRETATGAEVRITISANSPFLGMMTSLMQMPMLMQADPGTTLYSFGGHRGILKQGDGGDVEVSLMLGGNILLQLAGSNGATKEAIEGYLAAIDLAAVQGALTN